MEILTALLFPWGKKRFSNLFMPLFLHFQVISFKKKEKSFFYKKENGLAAVAQRLSLYL